MRLVVAALPQSFSGQRHGQQHVRSVECGLHPRRGAHQACKTGGPARTLVELEVRDQIRPRIGILQGGQTGIQWRCLQDAGAALVHAGRNRQGTGGATRHRLGKRAYAGLADAVGGPGMAHRALAGQAARYPLEQLTKHRANILGPPSCPPVLAQSPCLLIYLPRSPHMLPRAGRRGCQPLRPGCTRRWRAAWKSVCNG